MTLRVISCCGTASAYIIRSAHPMDGVSVCLFVYAVVLCCLVMGIVGDGPWLFAPQDSHVYLRWCIVDCLY